MTGITEGLKIIDAAAAVAKKGKIPQILRDAKGTDGYIPEDTALAWGAEIVSKPRDAWASIPKTRVAVINGIEAGEVKWW